MLLNHNGFLLEEYGEGWSVTGYEGTEVHLHVPDFVDGAPVVLVTARAFEGNLTIVSAEVPESVTFVGNYAFSSCPMLERVNVRARINALNLGTFWNCPSLVDVVLPDCLTSINDGAFRGCTALSSLEVPRTVTFFGDSVFRDCTSLVSLVLDGNVQTIERSTFRDCTALSNLVLGSSLTYLGTRVFQGCTSLRKVTILGDVPDSLLTAFANHGFLYLVADYAIPRGVISFEEAKKRLNSKIEADKVFAARVIAAHPNRLNEVFGKQSLARTLARGGCTDELRALEGHEGYLAPASLPACIDAANEAGHTATAAYLMDLAARSVDQGMSASSGGSSSDLHL